MSSTIILNRNNIVQNGLNNTFEYQFLGNSVNFKDQEIALASLQIYNSQFNINAGLYNNNTFSVQVPTAATYSTINITLPNGYYSYADISNYIESQLVAAGAYLINAAGDIVTYISVRENATYYSCEITLLATPTALPAGHTRPATGLYSTTGSGLPTATNTPKIIISNNGFSSTVGFSAGTYPLSTQTTNQVFLSNITPAVNPVSSYLVRCNLVNNKVANPPDVLTSFSTQGTTIGQLINIAPPEYQWVSVDNGAYNSVRITISDQNFNNVRFEDPNLLIILLIRDRKMA
jgi:hypothetical protein